MESSTYAEKERVAYSGVSLQPKLSHNFLRCNMLLASFSYIQRHRSSIGFFFLVHENLPIVLCLINSSTDKKKVLHSAFHSFDHLEVSFS